MKSTLDSYDEWHKTVHGTESSFETHLCQWHQDALALAPALKDARLLEVGCGAGDFAIHLCQRAGDVVAVDFSATAIEIAERKRLAQGAPVSFQVADAQELPFPDASFDVVFSCECLEHLPNPQKGLIEMHRVLKERGTLILTTENYSNAMVIYWAMAWLRRKPFDSGSGVQPIENFFVFWKVRKMMRRAGFDVRQMLGAHHVFLAVPGCHPHLFVKERFRTCTYAAIFRIFARHVSFKAMKI
ncbi:MAG TPA: class I SAM-dependent methyltransferase [Verrucomicrobiae bacterium]|jgi:ubiquinone/menaquinone biosynthesis C-methylase UbiE